MSLCFAASDEQNFAERRMEESEVRRRADLSKTFQPHRKPRNLPRARTGTRSKPDAGLPRLPPPPLVPSWTPGHELLCTRAWTPGPLTELVPSRLIAGETRQVLLLT